MYVAVTWFLRRARHMLERRHSHRCARCPRGVVTTPVDTHPLLLEPRQLPCPASDDRVVALSIDCHADGRSTPWQPTQHGVVVSDNATVLGVVDKRIEQRLRHGLPAFGVVLPSETNAPALWVEVSTAECERPTPASAGFEMEPEQE